jgi:hypothetical protein
MRTTIGTWFSGIATTAMTPDDQKNLGLNDRIPNWIWNVSSDLIGNPVAGALKAEEALGNPRVAVVQNVRLQRAVQLKTDGMNEYWEIVVRVSFTIKGSYYSALHTIGVNVAEGCASVGYHDVEVKDNDQNVLFKTSERKYNQIITQAK